MVYLRLILLVLQILPVRLLLELLQHLNHFRYIAVLLEEVIGVQDPVKGRHAVLLHLCLRV